MKHDVSATRLMQTLFVVMTVVIIAFLAVPLSAVAQQAANTPQKSVETLEREFAEQGKNLSMATHDDLKELKEGGAINKYVLKIGGSIFIINWIPIIILGGFSVFIIFFFFTPIGLFLTRGTLTTAIGTLIETLGISKEFGESLKHIQKWLVKTGSVREGFKLYMHEEFIPKYKNNVTAVAFMGTAFLIAMIGLRGIKFFVAHQPDWIMYALIVEITVLLLLGLTTWYESETTGPEPEGEGKGGRELSLREVEEALDLLKRQFEENVRLEKFKS